jgi:hypothetical protein
VWKDSPSIVKEYSPYLPFGPPRTKGSSLSKVIVASDTFILVCTALSYWRSISISSTFLPTLLERISFFTSLNVMLSMSVMLREFEEGLAYDPPISKIEGTLTSFK